MRLPPWIPPFWSCATWARPWTKGLPCTKKSPKTGPSWNPLQSAIMNFRGGFPRIFSSIGYSIQPEAAALLGEYAGTDLSKIALEGEKIIKSLAPDNNEITVRDIEQNVGITRQFSIFELTKALSYKDSAKAFRIAAYLGADPRFAFPAATSALFLHFFRILKFEAFMKKYPSASPAEKAKEIGVNPYFLSEYETAARNYPVRKCMAAIAEIKEYDFKGKGGDCGEATWGELLLELVSRLLAR